jgi:Cyclic phosphodiesterase-like protein
MKKVAIVYWLLPAKPERDLFCEVVRILRKEFGAPNFEPHLTLFSTAKDRQPRKNRSSRKLSESPKEVLKQISIQPIRLTIRGVSFSSEFTKTLFIRFKSSDALRKLVGDLSRAAKSRTKAPSHLHVSLLYKKLPRSAKKQLAAVMKLPFLSVVFDSIAAVRCASPSRTKADVDAWKILAKKSLRR